MSGEGVVPRMTKEPTCARRTGSFEAGADGGVRASRGGVTRATIVNLSPGVRSLGEIGSTSLGWKASVGFYARKATVTDSASSGRRSRERFAVPARLL